MMEEDLAKNEEKQRSIAYLAKKARRLAVPRDFQNVHERRRGDMQSGKDLGTVHPLEVTHKAKLRRLLSSFVLEHKWSEAAGVLSSAMEVWRQLETPSENMLRIRRLFNLLQSKSHKRRRFKRSRGEAEIELALYLMNQGDLDGAYNVSRPVVDVPPFRDDPATQLCHGLILHKLWYKKVIEDIKMEDLDNHDAAQNKIGVLLEGTDETMQGNVDDWASNEKYHISKWGLFSDSSSIPSNEFSNQTTIFSTGGEEDRRPKKEIIEWPRFSPKDSYDDKDVVIEVGNKEFLERAIILSSPGLSELLFPVHLSSKHNNLPYIVPMKKLAVQDIHNRAVKHLQIALAGARDAPLALLPLVQLLLAIGDIEGAYLEIEECCKASNAILPFSIKALLLESLAQKDTRKLSHCYKEIIRRNPSSEEAIQPVLNLHAAGAYDTVSLIENISQHLDVKEGVTLVWYKLSACFLAIENKCGTSERKGKNHVTPCPENEPFFKISDMGQFADSDEHASESSLTSVCKRLHKIFVSRKDHWSSKHFFVNYPELELDKGDKHRITYKAACATHLYGPESSYVTAAYSFLKKKRADDLLALLQLHLQQPLLLCTEKDCSRQGL
ncbi:hypothetical protein O6H91_15G016000 [Diphasiastrum complanatum]|uniref:Uncharacterized protein n=1 Tax=Diphasiastrum complanatum TaxID=34168 RepID=A0ACC2BG37_DIPCM|nr:hypothetical protein O6H91_15G016000 [Diphasiastrum complanatum]